ncbi:MAG TPA: TerC family protein [Vicinamibacterales bacterium]|nr:TerC family protein [Vicinamibacterales bacterium]
MLVWFAFISLILLLLALDLGIFHRKAHVVSVREGLVWSLVWMSLALAFAVFVYFGYENHWLGLGLKPDPIERTAAQPLGTPNDGPAALVKYLTGYVVEQSLSVDNMFVIAMLFRLFSVPAAFQHRVLFWGILGALAMRGVMIAAGATLVARFGWVLYVFGGFLLFTAVKMLVVDVEKQDPAKNVIVRLARRWFPVTKSYHGEHFVVRRGKRWLLTPLAIALLMVETTDLLFAVDSIPAILAITADPFLVFASNAFAILGLRSLYFVLAGALSALRYLKVSLALVLALIGIKMLTHTWLKMLLGDYFTLYVLGAVVVILTAGTIASLLVTVSEQSTRRRR